jgi:hypothetical protein
MNRLDLACRYFWYWHRDGDGWSLIMADVADASTAETLRFSSALPLGRGCVPICSAVTFSANLNPAH